VNVEEMIVEQLAASESVLTEDEKELGVALVDIGGGTTDIAIYERGSLWHTAVIGGLQTERKREIQTSVPILSSIPILGNFFTYKRKQSAVESLIILITPHIVKNVGEEDAEYRRTLKKHQDRDYFFKNYEDVQGLPKMEETESTAQEEAPPPAVEGTPPPPQPDMPQEK
jgi:hypothetical protein